MKQSEMTEALSGPFKEILNSIKNEDVAIELEDLERLSKAVVSLNMKVGKRMSSIKQGKTCCPKCNHYFKPDPKKQYANTHIENRTSYTDAGYGEDDRYADYEITDLYQLCPNCQKPVKIKDQWDINKIPGTERDRWGQVWN